MDDINETVLNSLLLSDVDIPTSVAASVKDRKRPEPQWPKVLGLIAAMIVFALVAYSL